MSRLDLTPLFEPFHLKNITLNTRFIMPAMNRGWTVEVHGAHGYFIDQFFWPETNVRTDCYGGATVLERAGYTLEIVRAIRAAVGQA